jgi:hypothetical protein
VTLFSARATTAHVTRVVRNAFLLIVILLQNVHGPNNRGELETRNGLSLGESADVVEETFPPGRDADWSPTFSVPSAVEPLQ